MALLTTGGLPYPADTDPFANADLAIKALAEAVDPRYSIRMRNAAQSIPNAVWTAITPDSNIDPYALASGSGIVLSAGVWALAVEVQHALSSAGTLRGGAIYINGTTQLVQNLTPPTTATAGSVTPVAGLHLATAGDVVTVCGYQNSGGALNVNKARLQAWLVKR